MDLHALDPSIACCCSRFSLLKQLSYAHENKDPELIPMSFMTRKSLEDSWRFKTEKEADFTIGGGGAVYTHRFHCQYKTKT